MGTMAPGSQVGGGTLPFTTGNYYLKEEVWCKDWNLGSNQILPLSYITLDN